MGFLRKTGIWDSGKIQFLPVDQIEPNPNQPRRVFAEQDLTQLADSIASVGILQPLTVRRKDGAWELVAGERRLRAARIAGLSTVPCLSVTVDGQSSSLLALVENIQRRDLDFWEEALAIEHLITTYHLSQEEVARRLGRSQSTIGNKLRLLKLPEDILATLRDGGATERHARALLRLKTDEQLHRAVKVILRDNLTVADTEALVERLIQPPLPEKGKRAFIIKDVRLFLNSLTRGMDMMRLAGVNACCDRVDRDNEIMLTIRIPRK